MKKIFPILLLAAVLMMFTTGCGSDKDAASDSSADRIAQLEAENSQLKAQLELVTAQLETNLQKAALKDWTLDAKAWNDGNGATITFAATPVKYAEGQKAALSIRMGELEAESTNCVWDGSAFTGSVELSAADGYSYYCILTNLDGSLEEVELNSPDSMTNEALVNLGSNLSAYANFVVEDWESSGSILTVKSGFIQCQMPRMAFNDTKSEISKSALVLLLNGEEVSRQDITIEAGEGAGSYEMVLSNQSFNMPAMEDDYHLELQVEVVLTTGSTVTATGGNWFSNGGELQLVVG